MYLAETADFLELLFLIIGISCLWHFAIRPVVLDIIRSALYKSRDDLRSWYMSLSSASQEKQNFSYLFMERAINCVASSAEEVTVWRILLMKANYSENKKGLQTLELQLKRYAQERSVEIKAIDQQHSLLFGLLLLTNSPVACMYWVLKSIYQIVKSAARAENFVRPVKEQVNSFRDASHQQVSFT